MKVSRHARATATMTTALAAIGLAAAASGCALVVPAAWRLGSPVPLSGPIGPSEGDVPDLRDVDTAELERMADADERRLIEVASDTGSEVLAEDRLVESRAIAARLPALRAELRARGVRDANERVRHPTIR